MNLITVKDLNFLEPIASKQPTIRGGDGLGLSLPFLSGIAIAALGDLDFGDENTNNTGKVTKQSQATASYTGDKGGSTETYTYSS